MPYINKQVIIDTQAEEFNADLEQIGKPEDFLQEDFDIIRAAERVVRRALIIQTEEEHIKATSKTILENLKKTKEGLKAYFGPMLDMLIDGIEEKTGKKTWNCMYGRIARRPVDAKVIVNQNVPQEQWPPELTYQRLEIADQGKMVQLMNDLAGRKLKINGNEYDFYELIKTTASLNVEMIKALGEELAETGALDGLTEQARDCGLLTVIPKHDEVYIWPAKGKPAD